ELAWLDLEVQGSERGVDTSPGGGESLGHAAELDCVFDLRNSGEEFVRRKRLGSLRPFWSFWSAAARVARATIQCTGAPDEDPLTARLPDPRPSGLHRRADRRGGRGAGRLAGEPGAGPPIPAAFAGD